jgi:alpha-2-macroglobulin-like protein
LLLADAQGQATIEFELSDAVTAFQVTADAHGRQRIGSSTTEIVSRLPFSLEPKLPLEVNAGDTIDLPVAVNNETQAELPVKLALAIASATAVAGGEGEGEDGAAKAVNPLPLRLEGEPSRGLTLTAGQRRREHFRLEVTGQKGEAALRMSGEAGPLADAVERRLRIVPPGFPVAHSYGGKIAGEQEVNLALPDDCVPGSLAVTLTAYPSSLADIERGLEGILQEPNGCFEQASSSNYPNVLSLQYLDEHHVADPAVMRRARELLKSGYAKLTGYECTDRGYEWFGGDPGHEALTAYGLLEFRDMAKVYDVDRSMLDRTAEWLRGRRDGQGGFKRNERALDSFGGAPAGITDAYITWALAESGEKDLAAELNHVVRLARASDDPYLIALAGAATLAAGDEPHGRPLLEKLAKAQAEDGHLTGKNGSITRSGGLSLDMETTALATLAWLKHAEFAAPAERAVGWLVDHRQGQGGFGSSQATILALKALVAHAQTHRPTVTGGELIVRRQDGDKKTAVTIARQPFAAGEHHSIEVSGIAAHLTPGENQLKISLSGDNQMPYGLDVSYRVRRPPSDADCAVRLTTKLADNKVAAGVTVALTAKLENALDEGQPMTVAILGLPAGLEPRQKQLDELKEAGTIDYYELRAREIICYWRSLAPRRKIELRLDLVAEVPGRYTGPASRAYLYYTVEKKCWTEPLAIEIARP